MTADAEIAGARQPAPGGAALPPGTLIGGQYALGGEVHRGLLAAVHEGTHAATSEPVSIHLVHAALTTEAVAAVVLRACSAAGALEHKNLVRVLTAGHDAGHLYVVTELLDGSPLRRLLARKRETGGCGFGARGTSNIIAGVCAALEAAHPTLAHGAVHPDAVFVNPAGRVKLADFGLGAALPAAVAAGVYERPIGLAPEDAQSGRPSVGGDIYSLAALVYEALVGVPLVKGGRRPSEAGVGVGAAVDQLIARCAGAAATRPSSAQEVHRVLQAALAEPATAPRPAPGPAAPSLAQSLAGGSGAVGRTQGSGAFALEQAARADNEEKWLVSKGRLDYGPFRFAELVAQIERDEIVPGNIIVDNQTGERCAVDAHPLLAPLVDRARQVRDDRRRAQAEESVVKQEKKRGFALYGVLAAGVAVLAVIVFLVVSKAQSDDDGGVSEGLASVGQGKLAVKISEPKTPAAEPRASKDTRRRRGNRGSGSGSDMMALDMSDDVGSETLANSTINNVIQRHGGALGGCLSSTGSRYADIQLIIAGPTGRVNFVRVNGKDSGGLYSCINRVLRGMKFPTVDGPRTRAQFDMSL